MTFGVDNVSCPHCGGELEIVAPGRWGRWEQSAACTCTSCHKPVLVRLQVIAMEESMNLKTRRATEAKRKQRERERAERDEVAS